jgi:predicted dehydrogenase
MQKIRIGVIGACGRGQLARFCHNEAEGVELVAGTDIYEDKIAQFKSEMKDKFNYEPNGYLDYKEMIEKENLDAVFVCSPDWCHEEQACYALNHKVAVYLEKPIAITIEGADRILKAAYDNNTKLMLGHNMRYMNFTRKMKEIIDSGAIGEVKAIWCRHFINYGGDAYFKDWHADRSKSTGLLLQKGAHDIDIIHWLAGAYSERVTAFGSLSVYGDLPKRDTFDDGKIDVTFNDAHWPPLEQKDFNPTVDVEDQNMMLMQLSNGVQASYTQCHFSPDACRNYTIIGTKGRIENYGETDGEIQVWKTRKGFNMLGDETYRMVSGNATHGGSDLLITKNFVDILRGKTETDSTPQAARYSVAAGCLATESMRKGGTPFQVPKLPTEIETHNFATNEATK